MFRPQILIGILLGAILMVVAVSHFGIGDRRTSNPRRLVTHASEPIGSLFDPIAASAASAAPKAPSAPSAPSSGPVAAKPGAAR